MAPTETRANDAVAARSSSQPLSSDQEGTYIHHVEEVKGTELDEATRQTGVTN